MGETIIIVSAIWLCTGVVLGLVFGPAKERLESEYVRGFVDGLKSKDKTHDHP